jgi:hypothetical protein
MMRRGPLDRYPVEWVLRQASTSRAGGSIEFHGPEPMTVFLDAGQVIGAAAGIASEDPGVLTVACSEPEESSARDLVVSLLGSRVAGRTGWYYHDPLEHRVSAPWGWDVAALLADARIRGRDDRTMAEWSDRTVGLRPTGEGISLSADGFAVVATLAQTLPAAELRLRLGWTASRMAAALQELDRSGALPLHGTRPVLGDLTDTVRAAEAVLAAADRAEGRVELDLAAVESEATPEPAPVADRGRRLATASHQGPLAPPPALARVFEGDARRPLQRLRSALR